MKKKILAISICVCICFVLLAIPVFAEDTTSAETNRNVIPVLFDGGVSYQFSGTGSNAMTLAYFNKNNGFFQANPCSVVSGTATIRSSSTTKSFSSMYSNNGGDYVYVLWDDSSSYTSYSQTELLDITFVLSSMEGITNTTYWTVTEVGSDGLVPQLAGEVFSVGGSLISFVMSHWIVLIPVVAFLVILCIGAIRKMIKGV